MYSLKFPLSRYPALTPVSGMYGLETVPLKLVAYCAEEVRRQDDTPWHVWKMLEAWVFAVEQEKAGWPVTHNNIRQIGRLVDEVNYSGYRDHDVWVGPRKASAPELIHAEISDLIDDWYNQKITDPGDFYFRFEWTHPFGDGNGRSGKILFNWLNGTLHDPCWPKDYFGGISNP